MSQTIEHSSPPAPIGNSETPAKTDYTGRVERIATPNAEREKATPHPSVDPRENRRSYPNQNNEPALPPIQVTEKHRVAAQTTIDHVKEGGHFSDNVSKYLNNITKETLPRMTMPKACRRFNAATIANDLDYGNALKQKRLNLARLTTGITDGLYQRIKIGGETSLLSHVKAIFSRQDIIAARQEIITALQRRATQESSRPTVSELLRQLSQELQDTNDRETILTEKSWWQRPFTDLSDRTLARWRQDQPDKKTENKIYDAEIINEPLSVEDEAEKLVTASQTTNKLDAVPPIPLADDDPDDTVPHQ